MTNEKGCFNLDCHYQDETFDFNCSKGFDQCEFRIIKEAKTNQRIEQTGESSGKK